MLTPKFKLDQNDEFVFVTIDCPYIKASEVQIDISGNEMRFYCNPYFLKLNFPGSVIENGSEQSSYDISAGKVELKIPKEEPGEFKDLDLLTKLMDVKLKNTPNLPLIEVLNTDGELTMVDEYGDEQNNLILHETFNSAGKYGFNLQYDDAAVVLNTICMEILEIDDLSTSTLESRNEFRVLMEQAKFDEEYYLHDLHNLEEIQIYLNYKPKNWKMLQMLQNGKLVQEFTDAEREQMKNLPNKECI